MCWRGFRIVFATSFIVRASSLSLPIVDEFPSSFRTLATSSKDTSLSLNSILLEASSHFAIAAFRVSSGSLVHSGILSLIFFILFSKNILNFSAITLSFAISSPSLISAVGGGGAPDIHPNFYLVILNSVLILFSLSALLQDTRCIFRHQ